MTANNELLQWTIRHGPGFSVAEFTIPGDGVLSHDKLSEMRLPEGLHGREPFGLILSGRGPIWLYAHLTHLAHVFAWLAVYDPRIGAAIVVSRHKSDAPALGSQMTIDAALHGAGSQKMTMDTLQTENPTKQVACPVNAPPGMPDQSHAAVAGAAKPARAGRTQRYGALLLLALLFLLIVVCGHGVAVWMVQLLIDRKILGYGWIAAAGLVIFFSVAWYLYKSRAHTHHWSRIIAVPLVLVAGDITAVAAHHFLHGPITLILLAAFLVFVPKLYHFIHESLTRYDGTPSVLARSFLQDRKIKALIFLVSNNRWDQLSIEGDEMKFASSVFPELGFSLRAGDIGAACADVDARGREKKDPWNWAQILRGLRPHLDRPQCSLRRIVLIGSKKDDAASSSRQLPQCLEMIRHFLSRHRCSNVEVALEQDVDFESFQGLYGRVEERIMPSLKLAGIEPGEIAFDVTGGPKTASITGVVRTLKDRSLFQYVQTNDPWDTYIYAVRLDTFAFH